MSLRGHSPDHVGGNDREYEFYSNSNRDPLKVSEQKSDMIWFIFKKSHSVTPGCGHGWGRPEWTPETRLL